MIFLKVKYIYEAFRRLRPGVTLLCLNGDMKQLKRVAVYEQFCRKNHALLFATDIAARGLGMLWQGFSLTFIFIVLIQWGSKQTKHIDGAEVGFRCPTMQFINQDASHNNSVV